MYGSGYFSSKPAPSSKGVGTLRTMIVWGTVTKAPQIMTWGRSKVTVCIRLGSNEFQNVCAWDNSEQVYDILSCLEKGDKIIAFGTREDKTYTKKDGGTAESHDLLADIVIPQAAINAVIGMMTNEHILHIMAEGNDAWSSTHDDSQGEDTPGIADDENDPYEDFSAINDITDVPWR